MKTINTVISIFCGCMLFLTFCVFVYLGTSLEKTGSGSLLYMFDDLFDTIAALMWSAFVLGLFVIFNTIACGIAFIVQLTTTLVKKDGSLHTKINLGIVSFLLGWPYMLWLFFTFISLISS